MDEHRRGKVAMDTRDNLASQEQSHHYGDRR
jgi:hypothetical protein